MRAQCGQPVGLQIGQQPAQRGRSVAQRRAAGAGRAGRGPARQRQRWQRAVAAAAAGHVDRDHATGQHRLCGKAGPAATTDRQRRRDRVAAAAAGQRCRADDTVVAHVALRVVADAEDLVGAYQLRQGGTENRQLARHQVIIGGITARVVLRRDRGLEVDDLAADAVDRAAQRTGEQRIEVADIDLGRDQRAVVGHGEGRAAHSESLADGTPQGIGKQADLAGHAQHWRCDDDRGRSLNGVSGAAIGTIAQQHRQFAGGEIGTDPAAAGTHTDKGADAGCRHADLRAVVEHNAVNGKAACQSRHAQHVEFGVTGEAELAVGVEGGAHAAAHADASHTGQCNAARHRATATAIGKNKQRAADPGQRQTDATHAKAKFCVAGVDGPLAAGRLLFQHQIEAAAEHGTTQAHFAVEGEVRGAACRLEQQVGALGHGDAARCRRPVGHSSIGRCGRAADRTDGLVDLQGRLLQLAHAVTGHAGGADVASGREPAPARAADFGADHSQHVDVFKRCTQCRASRVQARQRVGAAHGDLFDLHLAAVRQGEGLLVAEFDEQFALDGQRVGDAGRHAATQTRLVLHQIDLVAAGGSANALCQVRAPAV